jgi:hypothetical protein
MQPSAGEMQTAMAPVPVATAPVMAPAPMMAPMASTTTVTTTTATATTTAEPAIAPPLAGDAAPQWKSAAADLLTKTEHDFGRLQDPVYVRDALAGQMGEPEFRAALNSVLIDRHYKLATDKKLAPFAFDYSVGAPAPTGMSALSLTVLSQAKPILTEKGDYNLNPGAAAQPIAGMAAPVPSPVPEAVPPAPAAPVAVTAPVAAPVSASAAPASDMTVSATPPAPAPVPAATAVSGAQKPVIVTGPGSAPPPPVPAMAAVSTPVPDAAAPTYVYDGRSTNAPGRTAYEQREGMNREIDMAAPDDQGTAR